MSFIEICFLKKTNLRNGILLYKRRKTGRTICLKWESCMEEIVRKRSDGSESPYLLPLIKPQSTRNTGNGDSRESCTGNSKMSSDGCAPAEDEREQYKRISLKINRLLRTIGEMAGLASPLTMYVARHSWANIARGHNIPLSVISECMGHDSELTTRIYPTSLDNSARDQANNIVIASLSSFAAIA